eukprot:811782-Pyramimonas_sp.AAC.1
MRGASPRALPLRIPVLLELPLNEHVPRCAQPRETPPKIRTADINQLLNRMALIAVTNKKWFDPTQPCKAVGAPAAFARPPDVDRRREGHEQHPKIAAPPVMYGTLGPGLANLHRRLHLWSAA